MAPRWVLACMTAPLVAGAILAILLALLPPWDVVPSLIGVMAQTVYLGYPIYLLVVLPALLVSVRRRRVTWVIVRPANQSAGLLPVRR